MSVDGSDQFDWEAHFDLFSFDYASVHIEISFIDDDSRQQSNLPHAVARNNLMQRGLSQFNIGCTESSEVSTYGSSPRIVLAMQPYSINPLKVSCVPTSCICCHLFLNVQLAQ